MGFLSSLANGGLPIGCAISGCVVIFKRWCDSTFPADEFVGAKIVWEILCIPGTVNASQQKQPCKGISKRVVSLCSCGFPKNNNCQVMQLDNRGSHFYLALFWAEARFFSPMCSTGVEYWAGVVVSPSLDRCTGGYGTKFRSKSLWLELGVFQVLSGFAKYFFDFSLPSVFSFSLDIQIPTDKVFGHVWDKIFGPKYLLTRCLDV